MTKRIAITVESDTPEELIDTLGALRDGLLAALDLKELEQTPQEAPTAPPPGAAPPAPDKPRRTRASKKGAAEAPPPAPEAPPAPPAPAAPAAPAVTVNPAAMFSDAPAPTPTPDTGRVITRDDLRAIGNEHMAKVSVAKTQEIVTSYGVDRMSLVPTDKWPELYQRLSDGVRAAEQASVLS